MDNIISQNTNVDNSASQGTNAEKMVTISQADLDKIAYANKMKGYEKAKAESDALNSQQQQASNAVGQMAPEDIDKLVDEKLAKQRQKELEESEKKRQADERAAYDAAINKSFTEIAPKVAIAKQKHPDFDQVMVEAGLHMNVPAAVYANEVDNSGDVIYELGKSPVKLAQFESLFSNPATRQAALKYIKDLSSSIKNSEDSTSVSGKPITSLKPSPVASTGKPSTLQDWKTVYPQFKKR